MTNMLKVSEMFVFIIEDEHGNEGVPAVNLRGTMFPMVGSDWERIKQLLVFVPQIEEEAGKKIKLLKFTTREDVTEKYICNK